MNSEQPESPEDEVPESRVKKVSALRRETDPQVRADESVAKRFSRVMKASTSPYGVLTDPPLVGVISGCTIITAMAVHALVPGVLPPAFLALLAFLPVIVAVATTVALGGARRQVVSWLAKQPFPVENMNGLLNGMGDKLEVRFNVDVPGREPFNQVLEAVHSDCFALEYDESEPVVEVRVGVVDSKYNPARTNHQRYRRVRALVDQALVPLAQTHRIVEVRIC